MYQTTEQYKEAIDRPTRVSYVDGTIKTAGGTVKQINDGDILSGSLYITNQCVSSDAFQYGAVVSGEMGIILKTEMDRYTLYNAEISLRYHLLIEEGKHEAVPLGVYYVNEPNRSGKNIAIKALDGMTKLDKDLVEGAVGTPFELLSLIAERCGVDFGQTAEEIQAMPNGSVLLSVGTDRVGTYRDLLSYLSMLLCGFGTFDRTGKMAVRQYGKECVKTIQAKNRKSGTFSDFTTYYQGVAAQFVKDGVYTSYVRTDEMRPEGLLYDMGGVPVVQGTEENNLQVLDAVYASLTEIEYVPFSIVIVSDASIDIGDMVVNTLPDGGNVTSLITYYNWQYRGNQNLKSAGTNPRIKSVRDKTDRQLANLESNISTKEVATYTYTNAKKYVFSEKETEIIAINYATVTEAKPVFLALVPLDMNLDGIVEFTYFLDGVLMKENTLEKHLGRGRHFVTLMLYMADEANARHRLSVEVRARYFESDVRRQAAEIKGLFHFMEALKRQNVDIVGALADEEAVLPITTLNPEVPYERAKIDKTVPAVEIGIQEIKAVLYAQGLSSSGKWDGTINVSDEFGKEDVAGLQAGGFVEDVQAECQTPQPGGMAEKFNGIQIPSMQVEGFTGSCSSTIEGKEEEA